MSNARNLANLLGTSTQIKTAKVADEVFQANESLIINGDFSIAQRGTSSTANGYGSVDRFYHGRGGGTRTASQETLTSGDPYDEGFRKHFRYTNTTAGSNNATDYVELYYYVEAQDIASSGWDYTSSDSYVTLSFWVRSSVAGTYPIWIRDEDNTSYRYVFTFTVAANTWTKVTHSIAGNSNLVFNNDNGRGLRINWLTWYGSDYTVASPTLNAWDNSNNIPDFATTWNTTAGSTYDVTGIKLEVGSVATPYRHESYGENLAKCQRYYYKHCEGTNQHVSLGDAHQTTQMDAVVHFPVTMRATPTLDANSGTGYWGVYITGVLRTSNAGWTLFRAMPTGTTLYNQGFGSMTAGHAGRVIVSNANAYMAFDAEL